MAKRQKRKEKVAKKDILTYTERNAASAKGAEHCGEIRMRFCGGDNGGHERADD
jgi:hypothetical protein